MSDFDGLTRRRALTLASFAVASRLMPGEVALASRGPRARAFTLDLPSGGAYAASGGWRELRPVRAPRRFDLIGVSSGSSAQVRVRRRGASWSGWRPLPDHQAHGPDAARPARYSDPVWTGGADELQLRVRDGAAPARAALVSVQPGSVRARAAARTVSGPPAIVLRDAWGAAAVPPRDEPSIGTVQMAFVHHTVSATDYAAEDAAGMVLGIAKFHRDHNGWDDIGYNLLVDRYGQVFEGRAGGLEQAVVGAQAQGWNRVSTGIACLGTFSDESLPEPAVEALARVLAWKLSRHGVPVSGLVEVTSEGGSANRYPKGEVVAFERISGHTHGGKTECPGGALLAQLPEIRRRAALVEVSPALSLAAPALELQAGSRRVRATGRGVLVSGRAPTGATVTLEVSRQRRGGQFGPGARQRVTVGPTGTFRRRIRLSRPGVYRVRASGNGQIQDAFVRSVRGRSGAGAATGGHAV